MHNAFQLLRHALVRSDYIVECVRDLAGYTGPMLRETRGKIPAFKRH
jgi:hypothetical protein